MGENNQRGITRKLKMLTSFLCATRFLDLMHSILIKLHETVPNGNCVMARTRMFGRKSKGHNRKLRRGATCLVCDTLS